MTPAEIVRRASQARIDLSVVDGQLVAFSEEGRPEDDLLTTLEAHKASIIMTLEAFAAVPAGCVEFLVGCLALTTEGLTDAERVEAGTLAAQLKETGGLGQYVIDLLYFWNDHTNRERLQVAKCQECGAARVSASLAT